jgi:hypothetical protein
MKPKKEMTRVVRTPEGSVEVDLTGKRSGRGAYICSKTECLQKAIKRLEKALQCPVGRETVEELKQGLMKGLMK